MRMNVFVVLLGVVAACALSCARETGPLPGEQRAPEGTREVQEGPDTEHARYKRLVGPIEAFFATIGKIVFDSANTVDSIGLRNSGPLQPPPYGGYMGYSGPMYGGPGGLQVPPGY